MAKQKKVNIKVDAGVYAAAAKTLKDRGTDLDTWVNLQLRAFARTTKNMLTLKDKMQTGKYFGSTVEEVVRVDPGYMVWTLQQSHFRTRYGQDVYELLQSITGEEIDTEAVFLAST